MLRRIIPAASLSLLAGCSSIGPGSLNAFCSNAANCARQCGTVATGASPDCDPWENGGRTRG